MISLQRSTIKRIEELMLEASGGACYNGNQHALYGEEIEKFALLIVKECADYLNVAMEVYTQSEQDLYDRGATKIKQHFGIEETKGLR